VLEKGFGVRSLVGGKLPSERGRHLDLTTRPEMLHVADGLLKRCLVGIAHPAVAGMLQTSIGREQVLDAQVPSD
jgi:hypothetical protein